MLRRGYFLLTCFGLLTHLTLSPPLYPQPPPVATFSIVAYDSVAEEWGVAVQSKFLAVGAVVPWARAGIGAIATQAWGNTTYGPEGLALLEMGIPAKKAIEVLISKDKNRDQRQLGVVDAKGQAAAWTGDKCFNWAGHIAGEGFCVQGNILVGEEVIRKMAEAFQTTEGTLSRRLIAALHAGQGAGGDSRGRQSAALLVVCEGGGYSGYNDRFIDLRVDDHPDPIRELERIYDLHEQVFQGGAYVRLGILALKQDKKEKANKALDRAISIANKYPENAHLLNSIAWELAINEFRLDDALKLAREAVKLAPQEGNIWDTLGEVYARLGRYSEAVKAEKQAVSLTDGNKEFQEKLESWQKRVKK